MRGREREREGEREGGREREREGEGEGGREREGGREGEGERETERMVSTTNNQREGLVKGGGVRE